MKRTVLDIITILSFVIFAGMVSLTAYSYFYIKNPINQEKTKNFVKKEIKKMLPELMPKMPTSTGKSIPVNPLSINK